MANGGIIGPVQTLEIDNSDARGGIRTITATTTYKVSSSFPGTAPAVFLIGAGGGGSGWGGGGGAAHFRNLSNQN